MSRFLDLVAPLGIGIFVILYISAANLYPGGSVVDPNTEGYDWFHNYWCDLMYKNSLNGESNLARPTAISGWGILCISILYILVQMIRRLYDSGSLKKLLLVFSVLAMTFGLLAATDNHDLFVLLSFPFGAVTVLALAIKAQQMNSIFIKVVAWLVVLSLTASFIMYFTSIGLYWIGFIQKIALGLSFIWIVKFYYHTIKYFKLTV